MRVYHDCSVEPQVLEALAKQGVELVNMDSRCAALVPVDDISNAVPIAEFRCVEYDTSVLPTGMEDGDPNGGTLIGASWYWLVLVGTGLVLVGTGLVLVWSRTHVPFLAVAP